MAIRDARCGGWWIMHSPQPLLPAMPSKNGEGNTPTIQADKKATTIDAYKEFLFAKRASIKLADLF
jgi:hypothetical protein